jgi:hypothetical protein
MDDSLTADDEHVFARKVFPIRRKVGWTLWRSGLRRALATSEKFYFGFGIERWEEVILFPRLQIDLVHHTIL